MIWIYEVVLLGAVLAALLNVPMISVLLVVIALLWAVTMFFEKIVLYVTTKKKDKDAETSRGQKTGKKVKAKTQEAVTTKGPKHANPEPSNRGSLLGASKVTSASMLTATLDIAGNDDDGNDDDDSQEEEDDALNDDDQDDDDGNDDSQDDDDDEDDDDALNDDDLGEDRQQDEGVVIASTIKNQLPSWQDEEIEDVPLELLPNASFAENLQEVIDAEPEAEPVLLSSYLNRMDIIKTAAFDLGRLVRKRERRQQAEEVAGRLVEIINYYKMNADRNVGDIFRTEAVREESNQEAQEDRFAIYARLQNASLTAQLDKEDAAEKV